MMSIKHKGVEICDLGQDFRHDSVDYNVLIKGRPTNQWVRVVSNFSHAMAPPGGSVFVMERAKDSMLRLPAVEVCRVGGGEEFSFVKLRTFRGVKGITLQPSTGFNIENATALPRRRITVIGW